MEYMSTEAGVTLTNSLLDGWDVALEILLIVLALDYLTGVVAAFKTKTVSSSTGYSGLVKKASIFIIVILAAQMDRMIGNANHIFRNCTAMFFTANDAISILENAGRMGMKLPAFLENAFAKLQKQNMRIAAHEANQITDDSASQVNQNNEKGPSVTTFTDSTNGPT